MNIMRWKGKAYINKKGNREVNVMGIKAIRKKNSHARTLLGREKSSNNFSDELIKQCKDEFITFVKPIRDKVLIRNEGKL